MEKGSSEEREEERKAGREKEVPKIHTGVRTYPVLCTAADRVASLPGIKSEASEEQFVFHPLSREELGQVWRTGEQMGGVERGAEVRRLGGRPG